MERTGFTLRGSMAEIDGDRDAIFRFNNESIGGKAVDVDSFNSLDRVVVAHDAALQFFRTQAIYMPYFRAPLMDGVAGGECSIDEAAVVFSGFF